MQLLLAAILYCFFSNRLSTPTIVQPVMMTSENSNINDNDGQQEQEILALPSSVSSDGVRQFALGETLKLDELGPIIINTDGTTRRITNWDKLTKNEQTTTWRLISARNKKRIEELKQNAQAEAMKTAATTTDVEVEQNKE